jgi:hypothetical protein
MPWLTDYFDPSPPRIAISFRRPISSVLARA